MKKVMVAIDENDYSYHALIWALDNLQELTMASSSLLIFASHSAPSCGSIYSSQHGCFSFYAPFASSSQLTSSIEERNKKRTLALLEKAKSICASRGVKAETIIESGEFRELICNAVVNNEIGLLVIGDEASSSLKRAFLGSLGSYCLNNAKCPVLVVTKRE